MEQLTILVRKVLIDNEVARGDDYVLIADILALYEPRMVSFDYIVKHHNDHHLPSFESITRARRKLQEQFPELRANVRARAEKEVAMEEYSKLTRDEIDSF